MLLWLCAFLQLPKQLQCKNMMCSKLQSESLL